MADLGTPPVRMRTTDPALRFQALADDACTKLELALRLTDFPSTVLQARQYLSELRATEKLAASGGDYGNAVAGAALGTWGRNGRGPAIDGVLSAAKFHGKPWRLRWDAARDAARVGASA